MWTSTDPSVRFLAQPITSNPLAVVFYGVAESDALHAPLEDSSFRNHDVVLSDFLLGEKTDIRFYSFVR